MHRFSAYVDDNKVYDGNSLDTAVKLVHAQMRAGNRNVIVYDNHYADDGLGAVYVDHWDEDNVEAYKRDHPQKEEQDA